MYLVNVDIPVGEQSSNSEAILTPVWEPGKSLQCSTQSFLVESFVSQCTIIDVNEMLLCELVQMLVVKEIRHAAFDFFNRP